MSIMEKMDLALVRDMFIYVAQNMEESKEYLTGLDQAVGDGDHGISMARGFKAMRFKLKEQNFDSVGNLLRDVGNTLMMSTGGAAGAVFGSFFKGGAADLIDKNDFGAAALATMLTKGLEAVKKRGGAKPGDKTMIDALEPAALKAMEMRQSPLGQTLAAAAAAAAAGFEKTRNMQAVTGKAKTLGERTLGHPDPGAASMSLILKFMSEFTGEQNERGN